MTRRIVGCRWWLPCLCLALTAAAVARSAETAFTISDQWAAAPLLEGTAPRELWFHDRSPDAGPSANVGPSAGIGGSAEIAAASPVTCTIAGDAQNCLGAEDCFRPLFPAHRSGWSVTGWVAAGFTANPDNPANPPGGVGNLPTSFNYRNDEFVLHQAAAVLERTAENCGCGWAWGGRVDLLYGEDYIFTQAAGWETRQDFTNHWNCADGCGGLGETARMGLAVPQAYAEVVRDHLRLQVGHFYSPMGYETVAATGNFFYSRSFSRQYGLPFTHTGGLLHWRASDGWALFAGAVNGWDKFDAISDRAAFLGGATYRPWHQQYSLGFSFITGEEDGSDPPVSGRRTTYSLVFDWQINERWQAVLQQDTGWQQNGGLPGEDGEWYSLYHYLFYCWNDDVRLGTRVGWFNDDDGARIFPGVPGHMFEATLGMNVQLTPNVLLRPEVRWNWFDIHEGIPDGLGPFSGNGPDGVFGSLFNLDEQFLAAVDLVVRW
jgi:hypothetical protein